jgi:O-antigen/teichoic acid export membrane protein
MTTPLSCESPASICADRAAPAAQIGRNIAASYLARAVNLIALLALTPILTRWLGLRRYGEWLVIASVLPYLALAGIGIDQTLANRIAEAASAGRRDRISGLISTAFVAYCACAACAAGLLWMGTGVLARLALPESPADVVRPLLIVGLLYCLALPCNAFAMALRGLERVDRERGAAAWSSFSGALGLGAAAIGGYGLSGLAVAQGLAAVGRGLVTARRACALNGAATPRLRAFSARILRGLIRPSLGFFALQIAGIIGFGIDNLVIGHALGAEMVTRYAVPYLLIMGVEGMFATFQAALVPTIAAKHARRDRSGLRGAFFLSMRLGLLFASAGAIVFLLAGPGLVRLWAGDGVYPGAAAYALQVALFMIQVLLETPHAILVATTRHYGAAAIHWLESALNLALSLWWVRRWGVAGVIAGTVAARGATSAWYLFAAAIGVLDIALARLMREMTRALALAGAAGMAAMLLDGKLAAGATVARCFSGCVLSVALAAAFAACAISRHERRMLAGELRRILRKPGCA